jgi:hypothetical protein
MQSVRYAGGRSISSTKNPQKTYWLGTVWPGHCGLGDNATYDEKMSAFRIWWKRMEKVSGIAFRTGQVEVGDDNKPHIQVAIRCKPPKRFTTLVKELPASWLPVTGDDGPTRVKNYCSKTEGRLEFLGQDGEVPGGRSGGHGSAKSRALQYLADGHDPVWIARNDPEAYFIHHRAIEKLWETLSGGYGWQ